MRIGLMVSISVFGRPTLENIMSTAEAADLAGFDTLWTSGRLDALSQLTLATTHTNRIELGTGIVPTYPRHPHALVQQALTVQMASLGRLVLGTGVSHEAPMSALGFDRSAPVRHPASI